MATKLNARMRAALGLLFVAIQLGAFTSSVHGMVMSPEPIDQPLPNELRTPLARLLQEIGVKDFERVLTNTKVGGVGGWEPDVVIFRLEDTSTCIKDLCLSVIGHVDEKGIHVGVIVLAGKLMTVGDVYMDPFGNPGAPQIWLLRTKDMETDPTLVTLWRTSKGWIVAPAFK